MTSALRVLMTAAKVEISGRMAYRADFMITAGMAFIMESVIPLVTLLIYNTSSGFPGWNLYEVLLIQSVFMLSRGIAYTLFFGIVYNTLSHVREGTFDLLLIKPRSVLFLAAVTAIDSENAGMFLGGILLFTFSLLHLPAPGILEILQFCVLLVLSLSVLLSFALIMSGTVFKWVGNSRVYEIYESVASFGYYPKSIFSRSLQLVISYAIPVAMIGFYPAAALLGKPDSGILAAGIVCCLFLFASIRFWYWMLKKYTSAGG